MKIAVGFIAFDRYHLIKKTLEAALRSLPTSVEFRVFQDGWLDTNTSKTTGSEERIRRCLELYIQKNIKPTFAGPENVGVARNYFRAELWAFETIGADFLITIEDDIFVSENFFEYMLGVCELVNGDSRFGFFSGYGNSSWSRSRQYMFRNQLCVPHHRWAGCMDRETWRSGREIYEEYLHIIGETNYQNRPHDEITKFISKLTPSPYLENITSQDAVHTAIMLLLGKCAFMSPLSYAVNFGKRGIHFHPSQFQARRKYIKGKNFPFPFAASLSKRDFEKSIIRLYSENRNFSYW